MTPDQIIEVLQGVKAGRKWEANRSDDANKPRWVAPVDQSLDYLRRCGLIDIRLAPLPDEITIPARVIPAPLREAPIVGTPYYVVSLTDEKSLCFLSLWDDDDTDNQRLARGLVYLDEGSAIKAGKAMCPYA